MVCASAVHAYVSFSGGEVRGHAARLGPGTHQGGIGEQTALTLRCEVADVEAKRQHRPRGQPTVVPAIGVE